MDPAGGVFELPHSGHAWQSPEGLDGCDGAVRPPLFSAAANGHLKVCGDALFVCLCLWLCLEGCFVLRFSVCFVFVEIDRLLEKVMC